MVHLEVVAITDTAQDGTEDHLVDVLDALAAGADEMVMMLGNARCVGGDVTGALKPRRHARFDLRFERAIDGREAETRMGAVQAFMQLLSGHCLALSRECLRHYDPLLGEAPTSRGDAFRERRAGRCLAHVHSIRRGVITSSMILIS